MAPIPLLQTSFDEAYSLFQQYYPQFEQYVLIDFGISGRCIMTMAEAVETASAITNAQTSAEKYHHPIVVNRIQPPKITPLSAEEFMLNWLANYFNTHVADILPFIDELAPIKYCRRDVVFTPPDLNELHYHTQAFKDLAEPELAQPPQSVDELINF